MPTILRFGLLQLADLIKLVQNDTSFAPIKKRSIFKFNSA